MRKQERKTEIIKIRVTKKVKNHIKGLAMVYGAKNISEFILFQIFNAALIEQKNKRD